MIIKANPESFGQNQSIKTKYDFLFSNYYQLEDDNGEIKVNYLIGRCWGIVSINLTELFEENKLTFKIQKFASKGHNYQNITFRYNSKLDEFVEFYEIHLKAFLRTTNKLSDDDKIQQLEAILLHLDTDLLEYFEPILHNYIY